MSLADDIQWHLEGESAQVSRRWTSPWRSIADRFTAFDESMTACSVSSLDWRSRSHDRGNHARREQTITTTKCGVSRRGEGRELLQRGEFTRVVPAPPVLPESKEP